MAAAVGGWIRAGRVVAVDVTQAAANPPEGARWVGGVVAAVERWAAEAEAVGAQREVWMPADAMPAEVGDAASGCPNRVDCRTTAALGSALPNRNQSRT